MDDKLELKINSYFNYPVSGKGLVSGFEVSNGQINDIKVDDSLVKAVEGIGKKWLNDRVFFDAISHFTGVEKVEWGISLERDNYTDGEIHRCILIDGKPYEYAGNWYEQDKARKFVKELVLGNLAVYK